MKLSKQMKLIFRVSTGVLVLILVLSPAVWAQDYTCGTTLSPQIQIQADGVKSIYEKNLKQFDFSFESRAFVQPDEMQMVYDKFYPHGIPVFSDSLLLNGDEDISLIAQELSISDEVYFSLGFSKFLAEHFPVKERDRILDYGTGTAIMSVFAAQKGAGYVLAIDNHEPSLRVAQRNIEKFGVQNVVELRLSNGYANLNPDEVFDTIVCFPPKETNGKDVYDSRVEDREGEFVRELLSGSRSHLGPGGKYIVLYQDNITNREKLKRLAFENGMIMTSWFKQFSDKRTVDTAKRHDLYFKDESPEVIRELITTDSKTGTWGVFVFEKIDDLEKRYIKEFNDMKTQPIRDRIGKTAMDMLKEVKKTWEDRTIKIWDYDLKRSQEIVIWHLLESYMDRNKWIFSSGWDREESLRIAGLNSREFNREFAEVLRERGHLSNSDFAMRMQNNDSVSWFINGKDYFLMYYDLAVDTESQANLGLQSLKGLDVENNTGKKMIETYKKQIAFSQKYRRYMRELFFRWSLPDDKEENNYFTVEKMKKRVNQILIGQSI